jgi:phosphoserine phosphatase
MPAKRLLILGLSVTLCFLSGLVALGCAGGPESKADARPAAGVAQAGLSAAWDADVKAKLEGLLAERGQGAAGYDPASPPVVVFDFDNTCIRGDIGRAFYDFMVREQRLRFDESVWTALPEDKRADLRAAWDALQALAAEARGASVDLQRFRKLMHQAYWSLCSELEPAQCYPWQVRFYAGYTPAEIEALGREVMQAELQKRLGSEPIRAGEDDPAPAITSTGIRVHEPVRELMGAMDAAGFEVWVVSAGPQWVVRGAASVFPVKPERVLGMRTRLQDGKLTTDMEEPPTFRQGKVDAIQKFIGRRPVLALGDSWTDAEMLGHAEHALLLDRGYEDLKKKADEAGWWLQPEFPLQK